jgi:hypothetical protein
MFSKISEEARRKGDGRRSYVIRQVNTRGGLYGRCRDPEAHAHCRQQGNYCRKWYVWCLNSLHSEHSNMG